MRLAVDAHELVTRERPGAARDVDGVAPTVLDGLRRSEGACGRSSPCFFQAEDGLRDYEVTGVQTCALPISSSSSGSPDSSSAHSGTAPGFPGASSGITAPPCYLSLLTGTLPPFPMHAAFPRSEYYGGSAPPAPSAGIAPIPS